MATIVKADEEFAKYRMFNTQDKHDIFVTDFDDGVAKIDFTDDYTPESMARVIAGCFDKNSNFKESIFEAYDCPSDNCFRGIELNVFGKQLLVTEKTASVSEISSFIRDSLEEFITTLQDKALQELERQKKVFEDMQEAFVSQNIQFRGAQAEQEWRGWSRYVFQEDEGELIVFAGEAFARYVQLLILKRGVPEWSAFDEGYDAVMDHTHANGAMLQRAFDMLIKCWKHGGRLSMWNDDRAKKEIDALLNEF